MDYNLKRKKEDIDFDQDDVSDWVEEEKDGFNSKVVSDFLTAFTEAINKDVPKTEEEKGPSKSKKKLTGKEK